MSTPWRTSRAFLELDGISNSLQVFVCVCVVTHEFEMSLLQLRKGGRKHCLLVVLISSFFQALALQK